MLLVNEMIDLTYERTSVGNIRVKERAGKVKDRYSSLAMGCYFANEMAWNPAYTGDDLGVITTDSMKAYPNFIFSGAIIKVDDFIGVHGLKPSMKIAAWYEFALRLLNNKKEIYVIPKIGYKHMVGREDSYDEVMRKNITVEEGRWLIETAEEECKFDEDRKLEYVKNDASKQ